MWNQRASDLKESLSRSCECCHTLFYKIRTALFLSCRTSGRLNSSGRYVSSVVQNVPVTVHNLERGKISVYSLLAADTLCFASKAEHALEHESRCLHVFSKRIQSDQNDLDSGSSSKVLIAWGHSANKRWRELIQITDTDDLLQDDENPSIRQTSSDAHRKIEDPKKIRRRRPLLLFFPAHNNAIYLGCYRALTLIDK